MKIENAQYVAHIGPPDNTKTVSCISCTIGGILYSVPLAEGNTEYDEIMKQVKEGTLTIKDAD